MSVCSHFLWAYVFLARITAFLQNVLSLTSPEYITSHASTNICCTHSEISSISAFWTLATLDQNVLFVSVRVARERMFIGL